MNLTNVVPATERRVGYLIALEGIQLDEAAEGEASSWLHAMPVGEYKHPLYGKIAFTAERLQKFAQNISANVRGIDLAIDYGHDVGGKAAGWVKGAEYREGSGLWFLVRWTKPAAEAIRNKEYRYFSPEFADEWVDATGKKIKDVVMGGGLTNRPFLKNLLPVNLSEVFTDSADDNEEETEDESMTLDEFLAKQREALGLEADADEDAILAAVSGLKKPEEKKTEEPPKLAEAEEIMKLAEQSPAVKRLVDRVALLESTSALSEAKTQLTEWGHGGKKFALPPAVNEKLSEVLVSGSSKLVEAVREVIDHILDNGLVELGERPTTHRKPNAGGTGDTPATDAFHAEMQKLMDEDENLSEADAFAEASRNEKLFHEYRVEQLTLHDEEEGVR